MRLTLLIPQLIWPEPEDKVALENLPCPNLEWLLAHAEMERFPPTPYEHAVAALFGLDRDTAFGTIRLLGESEPKVMPIALKGRWLCVDPVHLRVHQLRFMLADASACELTAEEARALVEGLNREFSDMGVFHMAHPRRWYLQLNEDLHLPAQSSEPITAVAGRRIHPKPPSGLQASKFQTWLNEAQMFLHDHPVNTERSKAGKPVINSLWLWGDGPLPDMPQSDYDAVWADDPIALGLARLAGLPAHPAPQELAELPALAGGTNHLVVLNDLIAPSLYENGHDWREKLTLLERNWFSPLRAALGSKSKEMRLMAPTAYGLLSWQLHGKDRWRFWRRPQPIATLARILAQ